MKHLAVALITVAMIAADLASDLWLNGTTDDRGWATTNTIVLVAATWWFWHHRDRTSGS